jgi:hypothetical protein
MEQGFQFVFARKLASAMKTGEFMMLSSKDYVNDDGQPGIEYVCEYRGRKFYCSESKTQETSTILKFAKILSNPAHISTKKWVLLPNRVGEDGLYLEA